MANDFSHMKQARGPHQRWEPYDDAATLWGRHCDADALGADPRIGCGATLRVVHQSHLGNLWLQDKSQGNGQVTDARA
jgi:hypothetical protein